MYRKVDEHITERLEAIVTRKGIIRDAEKLIDYAGDEFPDPSIRRPPEVVVKPRTSAQVSEILKLASRERIPVTPRGAGTGLCGGCVPLYGGIVLSLEEMNQILEIDGQNMMAVAEAGVTLGNLQEAAAEAGLFFPPHPGDESAQLGGLVNTNASGARAAKYGGVRNYVKGLEVVLPTGEIITLGGKHLKDSTGYSLLNLLIGSEGTLGVVTKVALGLLPKPQAVYTLVVPYESLDNAIKAVPEIRNKALPMAIEFIEHEVIPPAEELLGKRWPCKAKAYLMIMVDGTSDAEVLRVLESIGDICLRCGAAIRDVGELCIADTPRKQKDIMDIRSSLYLALRKDMVEVLDIVVPPARIAEYVAEVHRISKRYDLWLPNYGHAADGNVHTHLMKVKPSEGKLSQEIPGWRGKYPLVRRELHQKAKELGGMVSGEHGIGLVKKEFLPLFIHPTQIKLMREIKKLFDPQNILNPGKIF